VLREQLVGMSVIREFQTVGAVHWKATDNQYFLVSCFNFSFSFSL